MVDLHAWWRVSERSTTVWQFLKRYPPHGSRLLGTGSAGGPGVPAHNGEIELDWPPDQALVAAYGSVQASGLQEREMDVAVVGLPDGSTGVRADAVVSWVIPRSASERIPVGVREVDVTRAQPGHIASVSRRITGADVHVVGSMVDRLAIVQPLLGSCLLYPADAPVVTFTFRARRAGAVLAQASEPDYATDPTNNCDPMTFSIRGRMQTPLVGGGAVMVEVQRLLGIKLTSS